MGTLISSNAVTDSSRRRLFLKRRHGLDIRSGLNGTRSRNQGEEGVLYGEGVPHPAAGVAKRESLCVSPTWKRLFY